MAEEVLLKLCEFLQPYLPILNSHNVDYLTRDLWNRYIPDWVQQEGEINLYQLYDNRLKEHRPAKSHFDEFIDELIQWRRKLEQVTYTLDQFQENVLTKLDSNQTNSFKYLNRTFMSPKKEHEVDILCPIIDQIAYLSNSESIIDYGSGRGYLGVQLSHDYHRNVLGIESCESTVHSGEERMKLLLKYQKESIEQNQLYKATSTIVNDETNFKKLFFETFHFHSASFLLCGLHTCGSLACSLIHHYIGSSSVYSITNIACCYHLLEEKFSQNPFTNRFSENDRCSFPLSRRLIENRMKLGRNARMLAVQSFERNLNDQTLNAGLWYRALMQIILIEIYNLTDNLLDIRLGKMKKKTITFEQYVWRALDKLKLDKTKITPDLINEYWSRYESQRVRLEMFIQFKVLFSSLIEMTILLDRLVFIEQSLPTASSYLVSLFDPIKSPRRWGLISLKSIKEN